MSKKVLIVGGVAGGASAAARLRRLDEHADIILFEKGPYISFANCGLPYYIGGTIVDRERLLVQTPKGMADRFRIDVRIQSEVIGVDPVKRTVQVQSEERGLYEESYDELILSPGARPIIPDLPGKDHPLIHTVRNIPDIDRIKELITSHNNQSSIVIGGGFIGVEMAENLKEAGLAVTLVEGNGQLLAPFDPELAASIAREMEQHGINLLFSERVQGFRSLDQGIGVELAGGRMLTADLVILAIGVTPDTAFLRSSGVALGARGHILVDETLETNIPHIYAAGDAIEVTDYVHGTKTAVPLAGPANKQGRIIADRIAGLNSVYRGTQGSSIIKVFGLTGASTGSNEKTLKRLGVSYQSVIVHPGSHASYYPGSSPITLKLLYTPEGKILGAQAVGYDGVDKRIDAIATAIHFGGHISDLAELELCYAPPYSSAKDPVNMAGYAADNNAAGRVQLFTYDQLDLREPDLTVLLDVRSALEHQNGHIPDSLSIPVDELRERMHELDASKEIWVYCQVGLRGYTAAQILRQHGYQVKNLSGGYKTYRESQFKPVPFSGTDGSSGTEQKNNGYSSAESKPALQIDNDLNVCGLSCPGPLMQVKQAMDHLAAGQTLRVKASDPGFYEDVKAWTAMSGSQLLQLERGNGGIIEAVIAKQLPSSPPSSGVAAVVPASTMVVFSGDLDKAIASFIIANGAAASGRKVTMFFTFWGLSILRKPQTQTLPKTMLGRMFDMMLPGSSRKLGLSKMNMFGAGPKLIRSIMSGNNVASLEELIQSAAAQGVEMVACQMSMDLMGIRQEELMDGIKIGGVGYYLGEAASANHNLFI
ncbi:MULTISPECIES: FAD-dependent oxidoreductase [unclassified Paenibacillus]|uniref:FAD-dependent oxidoreductase n=1 Tax=unclassified Paenibacillus TaxID=185978 RepID=UPI002405E5DF|nr:MULTISPECIES: FAD-dependent oxidoreductase [unclassified Paenibacillus]MDF9842614.1 NADPH-dependent 2,4-dienoyl-CoA reductase/sulfur reductase-like enzyme/peroxiredoxin family protein/rhodanese-related sulfurtransferase/TusA-related sulfurtransferase [Paenibacillus sp. PastF-2]MDF9849179.1 NADPH-dependent 2,4-dienoyl-CoA reductase/sulfur reductase-like enzyme/peroxiredoxin family protein/rhodanese-related sulfurtransferase/TusA-related sulfurtransferase [Paenibacillus sp. PastM-2]MDF9855775.1